MGDLYYEFECGCKVKQFGTEIKDEDGLPSLEVDFYNLRDCPKVWQDMATGYTKGVFQLETQLGQSWCKKVAPTSIEQICALISLIRPGVLNSILPNGKSMAQTYVDRKSGIEPVESLHKELDETLSKTYNVILYQEQAMAIAVVLAGFNLDEADNLRKAIGKKDAVLMTKVEGMFLEGCKKTGRASEDEAREIFSYLRESQKYGFNACLSTTTLVETKTGLKSLDEITIGEYILAPKDDASGEEFVEVLNKYDNGTKELFEITLESNKTISCTMDHKFLCENGLILPLWQILEDNLKIVCQEE